jgi:hypothetical protein
MLANDIIITTLFYCHFSSLISMNDLVQFGLYEGSCNSNERFIGIRVLLFFNIHVNVFPCMSLYLLLQFESL